MAIHLWTNNLSSARIPYKGFLLQFPRWLRSLMLSHTVFPSTRQDGVAAQREGSMNVVAATSSTRSLLLRERLFGSRRVFPRYPLSHEVNFLSFLNQRIEYCSYFQLTSIIGSPYCSLRRVVCTTSWEHSWKISASRNKVSLHCQTVSRSILAHMNRKLNAKVTVEWNRSFHEEERKGTSPALSGFFVFLLPPSPV